MQVFDFHLYNKGKKIIGEIVFFHDFTHFIAGLFDAPGYRYNNANTINFNGNQNFESLVGFQKHERVNKIPEIIQNVGMSTVSFETKLQGKVNVKKNFVTLEHLYIVVGNPTKSWLVVCWPFSIARPAGGLCA